MNKNMVISRRNFLYLLGVGAIGLTTSGCSKETKESKKLLLYCDGEQSDRISFQVSDDYTLEKVGNDVWIEISSNSTIKHNPNKLKTNQFYILEIDKEELQTVYDLMCEKNEQLNDDHQSTLVRTDKGMKLISHDGYYTESDLLGNMKYNFYKDTVLGQGTVAEDIAIEDVLYLSNTKPNVLNQQAIDTYSIDGSEKQQLKKL